MEEIIAEQPLANFYAFKGFSSRTDFEQTTGEITPPFDPKRQPKYWRDLKAANSPRANVVYDALAVNEFGKPVSGPVSRRPFIEPLVLRKAEAATVNIPPPNTETPAEPEVPVPLLALGPYQYLDFGDTPLEGVVVRDRRADDLRPTEYTVRDQKTLYAIAKAVGL